MTDPGTFHTVRGDDAALSGYEPVRVGFLGSELTPDYRNIHSMAFAEGLEQGWLPRNVELVMHPENGLPRGSAKNATEGFRYLVDQGCIAVAGAYSSDNAITVAPLANELKVPLVSWAGTEKLAGPYCFRLGNGDCGGDPALIVNWFKRNKLERVGVISEISPNGEEYFRSFRQECRRWNLEIGGVETVKQTTDQMARHLESLRRSGCDGLVHMGYGMHFVHNLFRPALEEIGWDPPRITTTAFMFYLMGFDKFEGWIGIDQYCPDNPRVQKFLDGYRARFGGDPPMWPNAIPLLAYDTAAVIAEALHRAPILTGEGVRDGFERIRFMPTVTGGPRTHIAGAPYDHNLFKGDWLVYGKIEGGALKHEGLFEALE